MKECRYHSQILHAHINTHYEVTGKFATNNMLFFTELYIPTYNTGM